MSKSIEKPTGLRDWIQDSEPPQEIAGPLSAASSEGTAEESLSQDELSRMQQEKIASIRHAIASGAYDSDELLEKAINRMIRRFDECGDLQ